MKKLLFVALGLLCAVSSRLRAADFAECVSRVDTCEAILQEFQADRALAIPPAVWQRAKAVVIISQFKAGLVFGVKGGWGVVLAKKSDGQWSVPVLIRASEASFGLQLGGSRVETVMVITDENTVKQMYNTRLNVGVDAKAVAGPHWSEVETVNREILETPVLVYTRNKGLYAGATAKVGYLTRDDDSNRTLYNTFYTMPELLYGNFVQPTKDVDELVKLVKSLAP